LKDGLNRLSEFKVDTQALLYGKKPLLVDEISRVVQKRYYNFSDHWHQDLSKRWQIDFFVFQKAQLQGLQTLKIVFENNHFVIAQPLP
jgi:hypothetical protein